MQVSLLGYASQKYCQAQSKEIKDHRGQIKELSNKDEKIKKDVNYTTVYADGIKFFMEKGVCRLVFYQNDLSTSDDEPELKKDTKLLNFEVRMPVATVDSFCWGATRCIDAYMTPIEDSQSDLLIDDIRNHLNNNPYDTDVKYNDEKLDAFRKMIGHRSPHMDEK